MNEGGHGGHGGHGRHGLHGLHGLGANGFAETHGYARYREKLLGDYNRLLTDEAVDRFRQLIDRRGQALASPPAGDSEPE